MNCLKTLFRWFGFGVLGMVFVLAAPSWMLSLAIIYLFYKGTRLFIFPAVWETCKKALSLLSIDLGSTRMSIIVLIGPPGAGKTTFFGVLQRAINSGIGSSGSKPTILVPEALSQQEIAAFYKDPSVTSYDFEKRLTTKRLLDAMQFDTKRNRYICDQALPSSWIFARSNFVLGNLMEVQFEELRHIMWQKSFRDDYAIRNCGSIGALCFAPVGGPEECRKRLKKRGNVDKAIDVGYHDIVCFIAAVTMLELHYFGNGVCRVALFEEGEMQPTTMRELDRLFDYSSNTEAMVERALDYIVRIELSMEQYLRYRTSAPQIEGSLDHKLEKRGFRWVKSQNSESWLLRQIKG